MTFTHNNINHCSKNLWKSYDPNLDGTFLLPSLTSATKFYGACFVRKGALQGQVVEFTLNVQEDDGRVSVRMDINDGLLVDTFDSLLQSLLHITNYLNTQNANYIVTPAAQINATNEPFSKLLHEAQTVVTNNSN